MQFVVLDDGFQHRRLKRDLDIVLIDASEPSAADWCLPGGLMREPWSGLRRAGIVVLTRSNLATPERLLQLSKRVAQFAPRALCVSSQTRPVGWHGLQLPFATLDALQGRRVLAVCGIGSPVAFLRTRSSNWAWLCRNIAVFQTTTHTAQPTSNNFRLGAIHTVNWMLSCAP